MPIRSCRICLMIGVRVYKLGNSKGKSFIESVFKQHGFLQDLSDKHFICYQCRALLDKSFKFFHRALTAQHILRNMVTESPVLTLDRLKSINRKEIGLDLILTEHKNTVDFFITETKNHTKCISIDKNDESFHKYQALPALKEEECEIDASEPICEYRIEKTVQDHLKEFNNIEGETEMADSNNLLSPIKIFSPKEIVTVDHTCEDPLEKAIQDDSKEFNINEVKTEPADNNYILSPIKIFSPNEGTVSIVSIPVDKSEAFDAKPVIIDISDTSKDNTDGSQSDNDSDNEDNNDDDESYVPSDSDFEREFGNKNRTNKRGKHHKDNEEKNSRRMICKQIKKDVVRKPRDKIYKPSNFILSLANFNETKRRRSNNKYVYSDGASDSDEEKSKNKVEEKDIDVEFEPELSGSSSDSNYDRYDDRGRRKRPPSREYPMTCEQCDNEILEKKLHYQHYMLEHPKVTFPYPSRKEKLLCPLCGRILKGRAYYEEHLLTHGSEKKFHCHKCPKSFVNRIRLRRHLHQYHPDKLKECDYCGKQFKTREDLTRHIRIHTGEKPYKCHICGAGYAHKGNVGIHIRAAHQHAARPGKAKPSKQRNKLTDKTLRKKRQTNKKKRTRSDSEDDIPIKHVIEKKRKSSITHSLKKQESNDRELAKQEKSEINDRNISEKNQESSDTEIPKNKKNQENSDSEIPKNKENQESSDSEILKNKKNQESPDSEILKNKKNQESPDSEIPKNKENQESSDSEIPKNNKNQERSDSEILKNKKNQERSDSEILKNKKNQESSDSEIPKNKMNRESSDPEIPKKKKKTRRR